MMDGQMTIWDFMTEQPLESIPEEEMVRQIGSALGVNFVYDPHFGNYRAKVGKSTLRVEYDHYDGCFDDALFIGCDFDSGPPHSSGAGAPCDSIREAIKWFEKYRKEVHR
jgi:hypothetical protein